MTVLLFLPTVGIKDPLAMVPGEVGKAINSVTLPCYAESKLCLLNIRVIIYPIY